MTACSAVGMTKDDERRNSPEHNITATVLGSSVSLIAHLALQSTLSHSLPVNVAQAPSVSRETDEATVKEWLIQGRADPELASTILDTGGFACWANLTQLGLEKFEK